MGSCCLLLFVNGKFGFVEYGVAVVDREEIVDVLLVVAFVVVVAICGFYFF